MKEVFFEVLKVLVVVAGWIVVHHFSKKRDQEKEERDRAREVKKDRREFARDLLKQLREIETRSKNFHCSEECVENTCEEILTMIDRFSGEYRLLLPDTHASQISRFRRSITLENFECSDFQRQDVASAITRRIRTASYEIEKTLLPEIRLFTTEHKRTD